MTGSHKQKRNEYNEIIRWIDLMECRSLSLSAKLLQVTLTYPGTLCNDDSF